ncbi:UNVERIFIED_CONTAM: putative pectinesterase/pectinesterase inhibitor 58 [Sesamum radiatum]|uniref:Pectinesterase/pectinesterase inhibitor 58 n=1 Tax=Sesamum radiatum TaxID=300843 RepID=A0AAW2SLH3_SESRA
MAAKAAVAGLAAILVVAMVVAVAVGITKKHNEASDDSTKQALAICQEVLDTAIDDLKRSFDKVGEFDASKANEYLEDLKTWLSAVITNHETCIDAFENTTGTGVKDEERAANCQADVQQRPCHGIQYVINLYVVADGSAASRKLLSEEEADLFISKKQRSLLALQPNAVVGQIRAVQRLAAIASVPQKNNQMFVIHVKAGVYKESVEIPRR